MNIPRIRTLRIPLLAIVTLLITATTLAQTAAPARTPAIANLRDQIFNLSSQVPPELNAYALLRLVKLGTIHKTANQRSMLLSAFSLAAQSPYPIRRTLIYGNLDSRSGYASNSMNLKLDTLSLRSEIVVAMLRVDPELARQLFAQMGPPVIPPLTCSDSLIADPAPYFRTAAQIFKRGFSPTSESTGEDTDFLNSVLLGVSSGSELHSAMSLLSTVALNPDARQRADIALAHAINQINGDPRTFSTTLHMFIEDLTATAVPGDSGEAALLRAARSYIVSQATAGACIDALYHPRPGTHAAAASFSVNPATFRVLNALFVSYGISPITAHDLVPQSVINQQEDIGPLYWQDPTSRNIEDQLKQLRFETDKDSEVWQNRATRFLQQMRDWPEPPSADAAESVLIEKAVLYSGFIGTVPLNSPLLEPALVDYLGFLTQPPPKPADEILILSSINQLFLTRRLTTESPRFRHALASAMQTVPNPSVSIWAALLQLNKLSHNTSSPPLH